MDNNLQQRDHIHEIRVDFLYDDEYYNRVYNPNHMYVLWFNNGVGDLTYKKMINTNTWFVIVRGGIDKKTGAFQDRYDECAIPKIEIAYQKALRDMPKEPDSSYIIPIDEIGLI